MSEPFLAIPKTSTRRPVSRENSVIGMYPRLERSRAVPRAKATAVCFLKGLFDNFETGISKKVLNRLLSRGFKF